MYDQVKVGILPTNLVSNTLLNIGVDVVHTRVNLYNSQTERSTNSKQSCDHTQNIDHISRPTVDLVSDKRVEAGLHRHRHSFSEGDESEEKSNDDVDDPTVNTCRVYGSNYLIF